MVAGWNSKRLIGMGPSDRRDCVAEEERKKRLVRGSGPGWRAEQANGLAEECQQGFFLVFFFWQAGNLAGHFADDTCDGGVGESERLGAALHFAHGEVVIGD